MKFSITEWEGVITNDPKTMTQERHFMYSFCVPYLLPQGKEGIQTYTGTSGKRLN